MRILFTRFPLESAHGGAENQTMWLASGLREKGHEVSFLGSCPVLLQTFTASGFQAQKLEIGPPPVTKWFAASFLWRRSAMLRKLIQSIDVLEKKPDVIVMLSLTEKILLTPLAAAKGMRVVWIEHDRVGSWLTKNPWLPALQKASEHATIVCVSTLSKNIFGSLGFDEKSIVAIPNGVPPPSPGPFSPGPSSPGPFSRGEKGGMNTEKQAMNPKILGFARSMRKKSTRAEEILWEALRNRKLGVKFRRQHPIHSRILDFYCDEFCLGIELDGAVHDHSEQSTYDQERTKVLREYGIRIVRFTNEEVIRDIESVLKKIVEVLHSPLPSGEGLGVRVVPEGGLGVRDPSSGEVLGLPARQPAMRIMHIGSVARLSLEKGIDVLIAAIEDMPEVSLTIIGSGPDEGYLRTLVQEDTKRMGGERISIIHSVPDLHSFYQSIDVFVLPSRDHDPFGLVAAEAMIAGVPTIVTDMCGIASSLRSGTDALVVPAEDPLALKNAIHSLFDPAKALSLAESGTRTAREAFSLPRMIAAYEALFLGSPSTHISS